MLIPRCLSLWRLALLLVLLTSIINFWKIKKSNKFFPTILVCLQTYIEPFILHIYGPSFYIYGSVSAGREKHFKGQARVFLGPTRPNEPGSIVLTCMYKLTHCSWTFLCLCLCICHNHIWSKWTSLNKVFPLKLTVAILDNGHFCGLVKKARTEIVLMLKKTRPQKLPCYQIWPDCNFLTSRTIVIVCEKKRRSEIQCFAAYFKTL